MKYRWINAEGNVKRTIEAKSMDHPACNVVSLYKSQIQTPETLVAQIILAPGEAVVMDSPPETADNTVVPNSVVEILKYTAES